MFDPKRLEHWLDGLQVETHFPSDIPQRVVEPPRSALDEKMDRYDIFRQVAKDYENTGPPGFPLWVPRSVQLWNSPMYMPMQGANYSAINSPMFGYTYMFSTDDTVPASKPRETAYDRLKSKLARLAEEVPEDIANPTPPAPDRAPDYTHTITAWRAWQVANGELESLGTDSKWEPRRAPQANCLAAGDHAAPGLNCSCGYWSFKTRELLTQALENYATDVDVIGQVEIWGRVVECENGFRSEYAYPKELWLLDEGMEGMSWRYGVPVRRLG